MKQVIVTVLSFTIAASSLLAEELHYSGECKVPDLSAGKDLSENWLNIRLPGKVVHVVCEIRYGPFFDKTALKAIPSITNLLGKKLRVSFYASFEDKEGRLLACVKQNGNVPADASGYKFGSCMDDTLPVEVVRKIASCKIVLYVLPAEEHSGKSDED